MSASGSARARRCTTTGTATWSTSSNDSGFDSLWLSERIGSSVPDPLVAMAYAAGARPPKFGTSVMVLPGRNPVVLAKALAALATLSSGRLLPAFGLGAVDPNEQQAFGVAPRSGHLVRRVAGGDAPVLERRTGRGARFHYDGVAGGPGACAARRVARRLAPSELPPCGAARRRLVAVVRDAGRCRSGAGRDRAGSPPSTTGRSTGRPLRRAPPVHPTGIPDVVGAQRRSGAPICPSTTS